MRLTPITLALAPLALTRAFVLPMDFGEWTSVGRWASEAVDTVENMLDGDDTQLTIWQKIKDDEKYTRLVKILNVSGTHVLTAGRLARRPLPSCTAPANI